MSSSGDFHIPTHEEVMRISAHDRALYAAAYLGGLEPGYQPQELFTQLARFGLSTYELSLFLEESENNPQIFAVQRPESDPWWARKWHLPGTAIRDSDLGSEHGDYGYEKPIDRLLGGELRHSLELVGPTHLFHANLRRGVRGPEQTVYHWAAVRLAEGTTEPRIGRFFNAETIEHEMSEADFVIGHFRTAKRALAAYRGHQTANR